MHAWRAVRPPRGKCSSTPNLLTRPGRSKTYLVLEDAGLRRPRRAGGGLLVGQPGAGDLATLSYSLMSGAFAGAHGRAGKDKFEAGPLVIGYGRKKASSGSWPRTSRCHVRFADRPDLWLGGPGFARRLGQADLWAKTRPRGRTTGCRPTSSTSTSTTLGVQQAALSLPVPCSRSSAAHLSGPACAR